MKKRLLALILCLVMMISLLPITAAAHQLPAYHINSVEIEADGVYLDGGWYHLNITDWKIVCDEGIIDKTSPFVVVYSELTTDDWKTPTNFPEEGVPYIAGITFGTLNNSEIITNLRFNENPSFKLRFPGFESVLFNYSKDMAQVVTVLFHLTKEHEHDWRFTQTDSTLTGTCQKSTCPIKTVDVNLAADSVTLPNSPFNARLEGLEQFKKEVPNAVIGEFVYKYKGPGDSEYRIVEPTAANAKAGEYQVGVRIKNLPGPVESDGPVAMAFEENPDGTWYADLYVKYTAVDPKVTAQTGDNRPIELMMAGVVVFSALAAAAFVLDGKRKYRQ